MRSSLLLLTLCTFAHSKIFYTDKDKEQSVPLPINSDGISVFQEKILGILGLQRPSPNQTTHNADEFASKFMSTLYELMTNDNGEESETVNNEIGHVLDDIGKESHLADTVVSFIPKIRTSDESFDMMYETTFSLKNLSDGRLIAARMFVVLENLPLLNSTTLRVYRKTLGAELVEVGSQTLASYGQLALVSLNVTHLVDSWLFNTQQPFPAQQKLYLELNGPNGTALEVSKLKNLHCFGVGLFVDRPHEVERRVRRSLSLDLQADETSTMSGVENVSLATNTTPAISRLDKLSAPEDKRCGLRSLYVDFKDLGWSDWVIAPQGYYADFCSGECGFPLDNSVTPINHAIIQTLVHILDKRRASAAKCAAAELGPQRILFNSENNLVMKTYRNMRVIHCGCR